jgi:predicted transposase/invertase (TIGR01784 family)
LEKIAMQEQAIKQAYEKLKYLSGDRDLQYLYHKERMREIGIKTNLRAAREEGEEKGKKAANIENARKMKEDGLPIATICKYTDLSLEEIEKI